MNAIKLILVSVIFLFMASFNGSQVIFTIYNSNDQALRELIGVQYNQFHNYLIL